jgi:polyisoprenoid-binding protein YceI
MAQRPGRHTFGSDRGRVTLLTGRDGIAAQAGHDLTAEISVWSGDLTVGDGGEPTALSVKLDLTSFVVKTGTGGLKPLTDKDRREIAVTARKVLGVDRHQEATFVASSFTRGVNGGGVIAGTLTLAGASRPLSVQVAQTGPDRYHATASVRQTDFGIKPYTGFLGALRVSDSVGVEVDVDLAESGTGDQPAAGDG